MTGQPITEREEEVFEAIKNLAEDFEEPVKTSHISARIGLSESDVDLIKKSLVLKRFLNENNFVATED